MSPVASAEYARDDWDDLFGGVPSGTYCVPDWKAINEWWCFTGYCEPVVCYKSEGEWHVSNEWWGRCMIVPDDTSEICCNLANSTQPGGKPGFSC